MSEMNGSFNINGTTLVFLKSYASRDKFAGALEWVKAQPSHKRIFLGDQKVWVLDIETTPSDPSFKQAIKEVEAQGWTIIGETLWDPELPIRDNQRAIGVIVDNAIIREANGKARGRR